MQHYRLLRDFCPRWLSWFHVTENNFNINNPRSVSDSGLVCYREASVLRDRPMVVEAIDDGLP